MCNDCLAARESSGHWRMFDPLCIFCGARLIQQIGKLPIPPEAVIARRRAVLADWMNYGHSEQEIRDLVKGRLALESVSKTAKAK